MPMQNTAWSPGATVEPNYSSAQGGRQLTIRSVVTTRHEIKTILKSFCRRFSVRSTTFIGLVILRPCPTMCSFCCSLALPAVYLISSTKRHWRSDGRNSGRRRRRGAASSLREGSPLTCYHRCLNGVHPVMLRG